jgi:hypothetical protein
MPDPVLVHEVEQERLVVALGFADEHPQLTRDLLEPLPILSVACQSLPEGLEVRLAGCDEVLIGAWDLRHVRHGTRKKTKPQIGYPSLRVDALLLPLSWPDHILMRRLLEPQNR